MSRSAIMLELTSQEARRFLSNIRNVLRVDEESCFIWGGAYRSKSRPVFKCRGIVFPAHRFSYAFYHGQCHGPIKHTCKDPRCVNPLHMVACHFKCGRVKDIILVDPNKEFPRLGGQQLGRTYAEYAEELGL